MVKILTLIRFRGKSMPGRRYIVLATIVKKANKWRGRPSSLHFSEIHSTLLVNFHLQRHMGNFVIQVMNRPTNSCRAVDWEYASEIIDDKVD